MSQSVCEAIRAVCFKAGYDPEDFPNEVIDGMVNWLIKEHEGQFKNLMIWNLKDGYDNFGAKSTEVWISLNAGNDIATWWSCKSGADTTFGDFEPQVWITDVELDYDFWRWWKRDFINENDWFKKMTKKSF